MSSDRVTFRYPSRDDVPEGSPCADMHFYTRYSDSYTSVKNALALAKKRVAGVAITDAISSETP